MNLIWIIKAHYISNYTIKVTFNDGVEKTIDFSKIIERKKKVFSPLKDMNVFKNFVLDGWTLTWLNGSLDIAPETLYEMQ